MLIKIFSQKLIFSNVILAFLDHLKHKIFFNHGGQHRAPPLFKVSGSAPEHVTFTALSTTKNTCFTEHFITSYFCPMNIAKFLRTAFLQNTSRSSVCRCSSNQEKKFKLLKKSLQYRCFLLKFAKFLRTLFFIEHLR